MTLAEFRRTYPAATFTVSSGKLFTYRYYQNPQAKATLVLLTGGIGLSDLFYKHFARFARDFSVLTFDYQLQFGDNGEFADAVVSNYVYHNIMGSDKRALLLETLRVLKKGGVFAINDNMKPRAYGDMEAFAQELRDMGYEDVRLIDTAQEAFGSRRRAAMMMLGDSRMLAGRK